MLRLPSLRAYQCHHSSNAHTWCSRGASGEKCPAANTGGGGECYSDVDCKNGRCLSGKCKCYAGYDCAYCNAAVLVVGARIPGKCTDDSECGTDIVRGGQCKDGECVCYNGFKCSMCNKWGADTCDPDNFVQEGDTLQCPDAPILTGGAACTSLAHCGGQPDGLFGGQCTSGKCTCWQGYTCPDCSRTQAQAADGTL